MSLPFLALFETSLKTYAESPKDMLSITPVGENDKVASDLRYGVFWSKL